MKKEIFFFFFFFFFTYTALFFLFFHKHSFGHIEILKLYTIPSRYHKMAWFFLRNKLFNFKDHRKGECCY